MMSLNSFEKTDNPSQILGNFSVHDFSTSWNGAVITKEVADENKHYLLNQYICCKYIPKEQNGGLDALGSHEVTTCINRDTGEEMETTNTVPIGTIVDVSMGYNSKGEETLNCKAILWLDKWYNILSFLNEMIENGVNVPCSVEYGYKNYYMKDGVRYDQSPLVYNALCILNPIDRGDIKAVLPAYDSSQFMGYSFNEIIASDIDRGSNEIEQNNMKDGEQRMENIFLKAFNQSIGDKRDGIMKALSDVLTATEFNNAWISLYGIDDDAKTVTYESYVEGEDGSKWRTFKISYSENEEGEINVDLGTKVEIDYEIVAVEKTAYNEMVSSKNDLEGKVSALESSNGELETSLNATKESLEEASGKLETFGTDKVELVDQITSLNAVVEELKPYKDKVEKMEYDSKLETANEFYKEKFESLNAIGEYEKPEIKQLIEDTLDSEKSLNARLDLSDVLLSLVALNSQNTAPLVKEVCGKKLTNLIPSASKANADAFGFEV